jgi:ribosome-binding factor A
MRDETRRQQKIASLLREALSHILPAELRSFSSSLITVTRVVVQADLRSARVFLSIFGPAIPEEVLLHLTHRTKAVRHRLASAVELKYNPELFFVIDSSIDAVERIEQILAETTHDDKTG